MINRTTLSLAISFVLTSSVLTSSYANAVVIENPGFENNMSGWVEVEPASISSDEYSGSKSLKINGAPARIHQLVDIEPNTAYVLSAFVKGGGQIGVNGGAGLFEKAHFDVNSWTQVSVAFNSGSKAEAQIFAKYTSDTDSQVRFDDFTLVKSNASAPAPTPTPISTPTPLPTPSTGNCAVSKLSITASDDGSNDGHTPDLAVDGSVNSTDSRWSSNGEGQWIQFDLGGQTILNRLDTAWFKADSRTAFFDIETSEDGRSWSSAIVGAQSQGSTSFQAHDLGDVFARYVRVVGHGNSINNWNSLLEAQVFGCSDFTQEPTPTPSPAPTPTPVPSPANGSIPSNIIDGSLFELEGDSPRPLVNDSLVFLPLQTQFETSSGHGWRHEYKIKKDIRVAMTDTFEDFNATVKVELSDGAKTIISQYHAGGTGTIMKLYIADSSETGFFDSVPNNGIFDVYARILGADGDEDKKAFGTLRSGDSFSFRVVNDFGVVKVEAFGTSFELEVEDDPASYFKFGNYLQSQNPFGNVNCTPFAECYDEFGITTAKVTMTNVSFERREK